MTPDAISARLLARAAELNIAADSDEAAIEAVLARDVEVPAPTDEECHRLYDQHPERYRASTLVEADHILFAVTAATPIDLLRLKAETALMDLMRTPAAFAERARELSNCPSAEVGGSLGQLTEAACVSEFWQALIAHGKPGLVPALVHTRFGLHIVRIHRLLQGELLPFEFVRERIGRELTQRSLVRALRLYAEDLAATT